MIDPLKDIEDKQGMMDAGKTSALMLRGAYDVSGSWYEAYLSVAAFWKGTCDSNRSKPDDDES